MHYYNYFGNKKVLTLEDFSAKYKIRGYLAQIQHAILQLHRLIDTKKADGFLKIYGYIIDRKTLGFYLQCLNYQTFCIITKTKMDNKELSINLHFLCLVYKYHRSKGAMLCNKKDLIKYPNYRWTNILLEKNEGLYEKYKNELEKWK